MKQTNDDIQMFDDTQSFLDDIANEQLVTIDTDACETSARESATALVEKIFRDKFTPERLLQCPEIRERLNNDIESLTRLNMMLLSNDFAHKNVLLGIERDPTNASLYQALARTQRSTLDVQQQKIDIVERITKYLKNYQMTLQFPDDATTNDDVMNDEQETSHLSTSFGSKSFIEQLRREQTNDAQ